MKAVSPIILLFMKCLLIEARGPHHPRGEGIAKQHVHYRPTKEHKITQDMNVLHDTDHIQEHLAEVIDEPDLSNLTDDELEFYYFQVHDTDKNSKLDGLEILQAISHTDHHVHEDGNVHEEETGFEQYIELIDRVLNEDDIDKDGYLSYPEYVAGRKKDNATSATSNTDNVMPPSVQLVKK